jgi:hypothetical protein
MIQRHNRILFSRIQQIETKPYASVEFKSPKKQDHLLLGKIGFRKQKLEKIQNENLHIL